MNWNSTFDKIVILTVVGSLAVLLLTSLFHASGFLEYWSRRERFERRIHRKTQKVIKKLIREGYSGEHLLIYDEEKKTFLGFCTTNGSSIDVKPDYWGERIRNIRTMEVYYTPQQAKHDVEWLIRCGRRVRLIKAPQIFSVVA